MELAKILLIIFCGLLGVSLFILAWDMIVEWVFEQIGLQ